MGISTRVVVGIGIGGVVIPLVLRLLFVCYKKKKKRNNYVPPPPPQPPQGVEADQYGGPMQHWQQIAPPPADHLVTIPPKPLPPPPSHAPPRAPSPQPPSYMNSSGASSNYSGSEVGPSPAVN